MLEKFERYKLTFGPTPIEHLPRLTAHLGGAGADLRQAGRLQLRPGLWRQ